MTNNAINALIAWTLAIGICALVTLASGYGFLSLFSAIAEFAESEPEVFWAIWSVLGLIGAFFALRPLENFIRHLGYGLKSVEETTKLSNGDAISDEAENALADRLRDELGKD
ncbi:hypothetical protein [Maricaulis sp.]|uniref:hypothetical protein n=1 Tax=unclassified Maricaulis TaxID=2632371 RepID=UPI001B1B9A31|nr:hypothetical protein [Maricaulis sp.]MBO6797142.1 hypothetical protein [Maricaulis sp.]